MVFTIHLHRTLPQDHTGWMPIPSDRNTYDKFEATMSLAEKTLLIVKIVALSIFTLGGYFLFLKFSQKGHQELSNLSKRKIVHYVKAQPNPAQIPPSAQVLPPPLPPGLPTQVAGNCNNIQKITTTIQQLKPFNDAQRSQAENYLNKLTAVSDRNRELINVIYRDPHRVRHLSLIIEFALFDPAKLKPQLELVDILLKQLKDEPGISELEQKFKQTLVEKGWPFPIRSWRKRNPIEAEIIKVQRYSSYAMTGESLPADKAAVDCIVLKGTNKELFGIEIVSPEDDDSIVLVIKQNGVEHEVCVNKKELAQRLQLKELDVRCQDGLLDACFKEQKTVETLQHYDRILAKQQRLNYSKVLAPHLLMKIIRIALMKRVANSFTHNEKGVSINSQFHFDKELENFLKTREIVAGFRGDKLYLRDITQKKLLNKGGEGEVFIIESISSGKEKVLKQFLMSAGLLSLPTKALHETNILDALHADFMTEKDKKTRIPGIQKPFHGVVSFSNGTSGILQSKYEKSLKHALESDEFATLDQKLTAFYELLWGFEYCNSAKGLIHRDIKPGNIFFSRDKAGKGRLYLGDFGTAMLGNLKKPLSTENFGAPWTANYVPWEEQANRKKLEEDYCSRTDYQIEQSYLENGMRWDIFSLGCVLVELCVPQKTRYFDYSGDHPMPGSFKSQVLKDAALSPKLSQLIQQMLNFDPTLRPSIKEVLATYQQVMEDRKLSLEITPIA